MRKHNKHQWLVYITSKQYTLYAISYISSNTNIADTLTMIIVDLSSVITCFVKYITHIWSTSSDGKDGIMWIPCTESTVATYEVRSVKYLIIKNDLDLSIRI